MNQAAIVKQLKTNKWNLDHSRRWRQFDHYGIPKGDCFWSPAVKRLLSIPFEVPPLVLKGGRTAAQFSWSMSFLIISRCPCLNWINEHMGTYFGSYKDAKALRISTLCNDDFLARMTSFVQTKTMSAISERSRVYILRPTFITKCATQNTGLKTEAILEHEAPVHTGSKGFIEVRNHHCNSGWSRHRAHSQTLQRRAPIQRLRARSAN